MKIEDTYNIHKKISCMFPKFKFKWLCKKDIHNYQINTSWRVTPIINEYYSSYKDTLTTKEIIDYDRECRTYWRCYCCGKEVDIDE